SLTLRVRDANGRTGTAARDLVIHAPVAVTTSTLPRALEGVRYATTAAASGGKAPYSWSASGLPSGLAIAAGTGAISGFAAQNSSATFNVTLTATDANGRSASSAVPLRVEAPTPVLGGGTQHPGVTEALTVFVVDEQNRPVPDVGVRVRRNGQELNPVKEARTSSTGRAFFSGLGGNGTSDTFDVTVNGAALVNSAYLGFNAQVMTLTARVAPRPGSRYGAAMTWDPTNKKAVLFGGRGSGDDGEERISRFGGDGTIAWTNLATLDETTVRWTEELPGGMKNGPGPRAEPAAAYAQGRHWIFGGLPLNDELWSYQATSRTWTRVSATGPAARFGAAMHAIDTSRVLLFGGIGANDTLLNDAWIYDAIANTWTQVTAQVRPSGRGRFGSAFHMGTQRLYVYGGATLVNGQPGVTDELWEMTLSGTTATWSQVSAGLPLRLAPQMAIDNFGRVVVFGGRDEQGFERDELYLYDRALRRVSQPQVQGPRPPARAFGMLTAHTFDEVLYLFGGLANGRTLGDTWALNTSTLTWTDHTPSPGTPPPSFKLSGSISGAQGAFNSVSISVAARSGNHWSTWVSLANGTGSYSLDVPANEDVGVVAIEWEWNPQTQQSRPVRFRDLGPLGVMTQDRTANVAFSSTGPSQSSFTGSVTLPTGWGSSGIEAGGSLFGFHTGFAGVHWTGQTAFDLQSRTHMGSYYPMGNNRLEFFGQSSTACQGAYVSVDFTTPTVNVTLPAGPTGLSPGVPECGVAAPPVVAEGAKQFTLPAGTSLYQLALAPEGGVHDWVVTAIRGAGSASLSLPATSTLAPARLLPPNQRVMYRVQSMRVGTTVNLNDAAFRAITLT
ncbi:MAG: kelch repeat-containing protein, partial [Myxococcales bacterium]